MEKINFPKKLRVYIPLLLLFVLLVFLMPRSTQFNYDYKKGSPWMYETLIAQLDFPVLKTEAQLLAERSAAASEVVPYYRNDPKVRSRISSRVAHTDLGEYSYVRQTLDEVLSAIYAKGVISESSVQGDAHAKLESDDLIYVQKGRKAVKMPVSEVYGLEQAEQYFHDAVRAALPGVKVDSVLSAAGLTGLVVPDYVFDQQTTDLIHDDAVFDISRTQGVFRSGQVIVSEGEVVTAEIEQLLNSYRIEYEANVGYNGPKALQWIGNMLIAFSLVLILFLAILFCNYRIFDQYNKYLYLLLVFAISAVVSSVVSGIDQSLFYMMPYTMLALYLLAFFKKRVVFTVYTISLLPLLIFAQNGMELFVMDLTAGVVGILVFGRFNKGWLQFVTAFIVFIVMGLVWSAFRLIEGPGSLNEYRPILNMALAAFMTVAGYPLIYLFEKLFALISNSKLVDLSDTSNKLLRELADKAPGTFQHSLQVMNLSDAAARSIEANVLLVRAGALYHDIGKIANPQCFTENEAVGVKYHAGLSPKESAQEIIKHVADGLVLADKYGLPGVIKEFIQTHHGTTPTGYFLTKYLNDGGNPDDVSAFYYDGVKPTTKEQVILMICDAVEAASRSLKDYTHESISELVERIVGGKMAEGQLDEADISLMEINVVKAEIKSYLQQMYHSRVAYPKREEKAR
jgi:putative nucleotidyltransferase with HDIG domain